MNVTKAQTPETQSAEAQTGTPPVETIQAEHVQSQQRQSQQRQSQPAQSQITVTPPTAQPQAVSTQARHAHTSISPARNDPEQGILMIAVYHYVIGAVFLLATLILAMPTALLAFIGLTQAAPALIGMFAVGLVTAVVMAFCLLFLITGYGLWNNRQWARVTAITLAILTLLIFPLGTVIGGLILWHLLKPEIANRFV